MSTTVEEMDAAEPAERQDVGSNIDIKSIKKTLSFEISLCLKGKSLLLSRFSLRSMVQYSWNFCFKFLYLTSPIDFTTITADNRKQEEKSAIVWGCKIGCTSTSRGTGQ